MLILVKRYGVDIPFNDEFKTPGRLLFELARGNWSWSIFWEQHNDARLLLPKILWVFQAFSTGWSIKFWMYVSVVIAGIEAILLSLLLTTETQNRWLRWFASILFAMLLLHPCNAPGTFLRGSQYIAIVPGFLLVAGHWFYQQPASVTSKLVIYAVFSLAGTFTFSNGLSLWGLLFPFFPVWHAWRNGERGARQRILISVILALTFGALIIVSYFWGYSGTSATKWRGDIHILISYFFRWLGAPLAARYDLEQAQAIGYFLFGIAVCCVFFLLLFAIRSRRWGTIERAWPWLAIFGYATLSGVASALGRSLRHGDHAVAGRYYLISISIAIATTGLLFQVLSMRANNSGRSSFLEAMSKGLLATLLLLGVVHGAYSWNWGVSRMKSHHYSRLRSELALGFWREAENISPIPISRNPVPAELRSYYLALIDAGICRDPGSGLWLNKALEKALKESPAGEYELVKKKGSLRAKGWAIDREFEEPMPVVLTAIRTQSGDIEPISVDLMKQRGRRRKTKNDQTGRSQRWVFNTRPFYYTSIKYSPTTSVLVFALDPGRKKAWQLSARGEQQKLWPAEQ